MGRLKFKQLSLEEIKPDRNIVISEAVDKDGNCLGYSVAEQMKAMSDGKEVKVFLKGGLGILSRDGLESLKKAVVEACDSLHQQSNM